MPAATAILDRFLQAAEVVEMTGRSFRLKNGGRSVDDPRDKKKKSPPDSSPGEEENS